MKSKIITCCVFSFLAVAAFYTAPSFAEEDVQELKKQIEALQKRVEELEKTQPDDTAQRGYIQRWDPFAEMYRMQEEMDRMFQGAFNQPGGTGVFTNSLNFNYDMDMKETKDGYEITLDIKGLNKDKIDVQVNEHAISVKAEQSSQEQEESPQGFFRSQSFGTFMKTIPVPVDADTDKVKIEQKDDSLIIRLPKKTS